MRRYAQRVLTLTLLAVCVSGCGDAIVAVGDWPGTLRIVAGVPDSIGPTVDDVATRTRLSRPRDVVTGSNGTLYIAETDGGRVLAVAPDGSLDVLLDRARCNVTAAACVRRPYAIAYDESGALLIADTAQHTLLRYALASNALTTVAGNGRRESAPDGVLARDASLHIPSALAFGDGRVYIAEAGGHRIRVIGADGVLNTIAGTGVPGFSGDGGVGTAAQLTRPGGLALAGSTLYVADTWNHRVRAVDLGTGVIRSVAGTGLALFTGDGGPAADASLNAPTGLAVSSDGTTLFVSDALNHRVRMIDLTSGIITTFAGTGDPAFEAGGSAGATALREPGGLAVSAFDLLYIADTGHHVVWRGPIAFE